MVTIMFKIGDVNIKNRVVLAPMAGVCNSAYRTIIKEMGCGLIYAEMVSDKAITYKNKKTLELLYMTDFERPISQQIFGSDKESFVTAAQYIYENMHPDIIDINMGCPVPKVAVKSQAGAALLKSPEKITDIEATTDSLANSPVNNETEDCQFPKPRGLNIGAIKVPIEANILSFTSHNPWILKFDKNHNTMLIANISVPALVKKLLVFSNN